MDVSKEILWVINEENTGRTADENVAYVFKKILKVINEKNTGHTENKNVAYAKQYLKGKAVESKQKLEKAREYLEGRKASQYPTISWK